MYHFSQRSKNNLEGVHDRLVNLAHEAIKYVDFTVIEGFRGKEEQNRLYQEGKSTLQFPQSKHNKKPAQAIDIMPYPIRPIKDKRFAYMQGIVRGIAETNDWNIRLGLDWNMDGELVSYDNEESFFDGPHVEVV